MTKLSYFLNQLKIGCQNQASIIKIKYSLKWIYILNILYKEGYIQTYKIEKKMIYIFFRYYNNKNSIRTIKNFYKATMPIFAKASHFWMINKNNGILFLSTAHGIKTHEYCLKNNIGGKLLFFIS